MKQSDRMLKIFNQSKCLKIVKESNLRKNLFIGSVPDLVWFSVTRLGDFWKFLATHFLRKVGLWLFGLFWKTLIFELNQLWLIFGQLLETFGLLFISASGHTGLIKYWSQIEMKRLGWTAISNTHSLIPT